MFYLWRRQALDLSKVKGSKNKYTWGDRLIHFWWQHNSIAAYFFVKALHLHVRALTWSLKV